MLKNNIPRLLLVLKPKSCTLFRYRHCACLRYCLCIIVYRIPCDFTYCYSSRVAALVLFSKPNRLLSFHSLHLCFLWNFCTMTSDSQLQWSIPQPRYLPNRVQHRSSRASDSTVVIVKESHRNIRENNGAITLLSIIIIFLCFTEIKRTGDESSKQAWSL